MFVYVGKTFTATLTAEQLKQVRCEKCGTEFYYQLARSGVGQGTAHYYVNQEGAEAGAKTRAITDLKDQLTHDVEMVPCPKCHWINDEAVRQYRQRKYRKLHYVAIVFAAITFFLHNIIYVNTGSDFIRTKYAYFSQSFLVIDAVGLGIVGFFLALQWYLRQRIRPLYSADGMPIVNPGTPPALIKNAAGEFVPAHDIPHETFVELEWVYLRAGQYTLPPVCCQCLCETSKHFKLPLLTPIVSDVPFCADCQKVVNRKYWLSQLILVPSVLFVACVVAMGTKSVFAPRGAAIPIFVMILSWLILWMVGLIVILKKLQPFQFAIHDSERAIRRFRFANPAYAALIKRKIHESEGLHTAKTQA